MSRAHAKAQAQQPPRDEKIKFLPLAEIAYSPTNARKKFDGIDEMAKSIKVKGVLQPLLVRPLATERQDGKRYEIVAGERRARGAKKAGLEFVPCRIVALADAAALEAGIIENLQRRDVHPLDEAQGFKHLMESDGIDVQTIAQRVGKDARYVARRLSLTELIDEAQADFRADLITVAHALEISRLSPDVQRAALAACYEAKQTYDEASQQWVSTPDKEQPALHVRYLQEWLRQNVQLNLKHAPFKTDDTRLREDGLTCLECPRRSGFNKALFADIQDADTCLDPLCFKGKVRTLVQITKAGVDANRETPAPYITPNYSTRLVVEGAEVLTAGDYELIARRADRCEFAEQAVYAEGRQIGQVKWICREPTCKDHKGRVRNGGSRSLSSSSVGGGAQTPAARAERKQELFDIRVDEQVRKRVMAAAIETFSYPLEREQLNRIAAQFFRRISSSDQRTIREVFGVDEKESGAFSYDEAKTVAALAKLDDARFAQFMVLCAVAHFGANQYGNRRADQKEVERLSKERGVDHRLIDAEVRLTLAPKKYKGAHQLYLEAVKAGRTNARKPVVYEREARAEAGEQGQAAA